MAETINPLTSTHPHQLPIHSIESNGNVSLSGCTSHLWTKYLKTETTRTRLWIDRSEVQRSTEEEQQSELESEEESITSYEDGIDQFDGPLWMDPLDRDAVAAEMKGIYHRHTHSCGTQTLNEITSFEDDLDSLDGPVWDDPLDKKAVQNQMTGCHHRNHHIEPEEKSEARRSIEVEMKRNPRSWLDGEYESPVEDDDDDDEDEMKSKMGGEKLHRCSVDILDRISTEDLVAAAAALYMTAPDDRPLALCSHCGGNRLKRLASLKTHEHCKSRQQKDFEMDQKSLGDWIDENGILWQDPPMKLETSEDWVDENGIMW